MLPEESHWQALFEAIRLEHRLDLNQYRQAQLRRRLISYAESLGFDHLDQLTAWVSEDPAHGTALLDRMAINVSELFRNPERWLDLEQRVFPDLLSRNRHLRVWSAGCSYGAEAYTVAMILNRIDQGRHWVLGTDIDQAALAQARTGLFSADDIKYVPSEYQKAYLQPEGDQYRASAALWPYLSFRYHNLLADNFDDGFDLICCRNVVIYFTDQAKENLYQRLFGALRPGGYLLVGSTERVIRSRDLGFEAPMPFVYQKPVCGEPWRAAS